MENKFEVRKGPHDYLILRINGYPSAFSVGKDLKQMAKSLYSHFGHLFPKVLNPEEVIDSELIGMANKIAQTIAKNQIISLKPKLVNAVQKLRSSIEDCFDSHDGEIITHGMIWIAIIDYLLEKEQADYYQFVDNIIREIDDYGLAWSQGVVSDLDLIWQKAADLFSFEPEQFEKEIEKGNWF